MCVYISRHSSILMHFILFFQGKREIDGTVPLDEIPNLMRALGFYPSEEEVENLRSGEILL